ncbi:MAG: hypothetical protein IPH20_14460 [Bacteroidales bacterium]|nr:hypothetical protein [Bacteroidales bacterium]
MKIRMQIKGFDEFLRWIKIIEIAKNEGKSTSISMIELIKDIIENPQFNKVGLSLELIESYIDAIEHLITFDFEIFFNKSWLAKDYDAIDYVKLLPLLMYVEQNKACTFTEAFRFARFFFNITRLPNVSKVPYNSIFNAIRLTGLFNDSKKIDIISLADIYAESYYDSILTHEEVVKLKLFGNPPDGIKEKNWKRHSGMQRILNFVMERLVFYGVV